MRRSKGQRHCCLLLPQSAGSGLCSGASIGVGAGGPHSSAPPGFSPRSAVPHQASSRSALDELAHRSSSLWALVTPPAGQTALPARGQKTGPEGRGWGALSLVRDSARPRVCNISAEHPSSQSIQLFQLSPFMPRAIVLTRSRHARAAVRPAPRTEPRGCHRKLKVKLEEGNLVWRGFVLRSDGQRLMTKS